MMGQTSRENSCDSTSKICWEGTYISSRGLNVKIYNILCLIKDL